MFRSIGEFIGEIAAAAAIRRIFRETDYRLARRRWLVRRHREFQPPAREMRDVLLTRLDRTRGSRKTVQAALRADKEAVDLYRFTTCQSCARR